MRVAVIFAVAVAVALLATAPPGEAAISCGDIQGSLSPCLSYLVGGGQPTAECCGGVRSVNSGLQSRQDRQTACSCIKSAASNFGVRPDTASSLAGKCGVSIGMTVTPNMDCNQVS